MKKQKITFTTILITLGCLALLTQMQAVTPPPDGCYPGFTTAEGCDALKALTSGAANTGLGWRALFSNSSGNFNTAVGAGALILNNGDSNTAVGAAALLLNTGSNNTALGANAGTSPDIGSNNVYVGDMGFGGDENVIAIGALAASGIPYDTCYIGGIATNPQVTDGVNVCEVSVRLVDGRLGIDCTHPNNPGSAPDSAPLRDRAPQQPHARPAIFNGKVEQLQATVAQQQKQIETLTAQLREQAAQIQKVGAQLEASRPAPRVAVNNQ